MPNVLLLLGWATFIGAVVTFALLARLTFWFWHDGDAPPRLLLRDALAFGLIVIAMSGTVIGWATGPGHTPMWWRILASAFTTIAVWIFAAVELGHVWRR